MKRKHARLEEMLRKTVRRIKERRRKRARGPKQRRVEGRNLLTTDVIYSYILRGDRSLPRLGDANFSVLYAHPLIPAAPLYIYHQRSIHRSPLANLFKSDLIDGARALRR